ncbi:uncharacterized protein LODBEIA_P45510 [Lodderomyces beijingensis]|uniref:ER transporter 6TM N-terminal domain-containing protein n=1 Tax=Lodderomyces beijingensis TaxID=1775926 RepID=A0ABP0ZSJ9_9ASCO
MPDREDRDAISLMSLSSSVVSETSLDPHAPAPAPFSSTADFAAKNSFPAVDDTVTANEYFPKGDERNIAATVINEEPASKIPLWRKAYDVIYPNYVLQHLDYPSFKIVFRSWCYVWSCTILTIVPMTSRWFGTASYLLLIVSFISISGGTSIVMNLITACTFMTGFIIAFVHHVIRSKIINDLHGGITEQELIRQLVQEGSCQMNDMLQQCVQDQIFSGRYINTKGVAITILSIISCTFIVGNMRDNLHPLWKVVYIGGQIGNVIFSCYGHFSPLYQPLAVGYQVLRPAGISLVLKVLSSFIIYPTTSNFNFVTGCKGLLTQLKSTCGKNSNLFNTMRPSAPNFANYKGLKKDISGIRAKMAPLEIVASTIWLEYSYGRFDVGDIGQLRSLIKNVISASASYAYFYQLLQERTHFAKDDFGITRKKSTASSLGHGHAKLFSAFHDSYRKVGEYESRKRIKVLRNRIMHHGKGHRLTTRDIDRIAKFLTENFKILLDVANSGLQEVIEWVDTANNFRVYAWLPGQWEGYCQKQQEMAQRVKKAKKEVQVALEKFDDVDALKKMMLDTARTEEVLLFLISQGILFLQIAKYQLEKITALLDFAIELDERRPTPKFITYFTACKYSKPRHLSSDLDEEMPDFLKSNIRVRNADSLPPANLMQLAGFYVVKVFKFFLSDNFWFWIRAGGLVCIGAIPYFVRTTASWYYNERLVWLVIMISLSISDSTGQTVYTFAAKFVYTFCGCLLGMVGWYISCGNGKGNYYGFGAVTAVIYLYLVFFRHFSVHQTLMPQILFGVTTVLVLGTSWIDTKINPAGANVGYGFKPAWLRFVSVVIGLAIGSLAAIIPTPRSSKTIVRKILGSSLFEVGNVHCDITKFALKRLEDPDYHIQDRHDILLARFRYLLMRISGLSGLLMPLKYEIAIAGYYPESKYLRLQGLVSDTVQLYLMLLIALNSLKEPKVWIPIIVRRVGLCYSELDAEIFATIHMASDSLKSKDPLPKITEANISIKHMEFLRHQWGLNKITLSERFYSDRERRKSARSNSANSHHEITQHLDYEKFFSQDGQLNILALLVAHMIYNRLDEIMMLVKGLVGEVFDLDDNILLDSDAYSDDDLVNDRDDGDDDDGIFSPKYNERLMKNQ